MGAIAPTRAPLAAGMAASVVFVGAFTVEGLVRPGYDAASRFVSELAIGTAGWTQNLAFLVSGLLVAVFAFGLHLLGRAAQPAPALTVVLAALAAGLIGSAFFVTDPSGVSGLPTAQGRAHSLLGAVVFLCMPAGCFAASPLVGRLGGAALRSVTAVVGVVLVIGIVVLKVSELPSGPLFPWRGAVQRVELCVFFAWLFAFSLLCTVSRGRRAAGVR